MIEVFGFNTTKGGMFEMRNTTVEDIKKALKEKFPKWNDDMIEKVATNKNYYKAVIPYKTEEEKKKTRRGSLSKEFVEVNGVELNPLFTLAQEIHSYHKNANKYWGDESDKIFSNESVSSKYNAFEKKFDELVVTVKNTPEKTFMVVRKASAICNTINDLKSAFDQSGLLKKYADKEYVNSTGRRQGIGELMSKVDEVCPLYDEALN